MHDEIDCIENVLYIWTVIDELCYFFVTWKVWLKQGINVSDKLLLVVFIVYLWLLRLSKHEGVILDS